MITGRFLSGDLFIRFLFSSYLYALYRLGESEVEDADDPFPRGRIPFITIHQAKGLEFPVVVLGSPRKNDRGPQRIEEIVRPLIRRPSEPLMLVTPEEGFKILMAMPQPERTLTLLIAATGLRISECLGLQWADVDYESQQISVRRSWTAGKVGRSKSPASKAPVPLVPLLAGFIREWQQQTPYGQPTDWMFASTRLKGKQPRVANMLVEDYLRPAAVKVGVLKEGEKVRLGFHNLRHSLASFLVRNGTDVKTVQKLLRHSDVSTTLGIYAHSMSEDRLAAQVDMLTAMMTPSNAVN